MLPAVAETGLGSFCEQGLNVPESWMGSQGVLQVVQGASDGNLYQVSIILGFTAFSRRFLGVRVLMILNNG